MRDNIFYRPSHIIALWTKGCHFWKKNNHEMLYFGSRFLCQFSSNTWILFALRIKVLLQQLNSTCSTTSKDVSSRYESFICLFGHEDWSWTFVVKHQREVKRYLLALIRILPPLIILKTKGRIWLPDLSGGFVLAGRLHHLMIIYVKLGQPIVKLCYDVFSLNLGGDSQILLTQICRNVREWKGRTLLC